jgi:uncharacterized protein (TIGR02246 family)
MRFVLSFLVLVNLTASAAAQPPAEEEKAIRAMWERFEEFYNKGDAVGVASLYAADADRITSRATAKGRSEIQQQYEAELARRSATAAPIDDTIAIRFLRPDVAILDGEGKEDTPDGQLRVLYTVIFTKESGRWWIAAGRPRGTYRQ